jgi:hypothetical protein
MAKSTTSRTSRKTAPTTNAQIQAARTRSTVIKQAVPTPEIVQKPLFQAVSPVVNHSHWVKQLYFYTVLGTTLFFIALGSFFFVRANVIKYFLPDADDVSIYQDSCKYDFATGTQLEKSDQQKKICVDEQKTQLSAQQNRSYRQVMLNSILGVVISALVLGLHTRFVKVK